MRSNSSPADSSQATITTVDALQRGSGNTCDGPDQTRGWWGIFLGPAVHAKFSIWSYAFTTMIVILAPAVLDSPGGSGAAIWSRIGLFILIALYGTTAVAVFDAFWPSAKPGHQSRS